MPTKRRSSDASSVYEDNTAPVSKKARTTTSRPSVHTLDSLRAMPHDELAAYAFSLQSQSSSSTTTPASAETWTADQIAARAEKSRDLAVAAIKKQMKWQPTCKTGTTKWVYEGMVPHEDVFYKLFDFEKPKKAWKVKKMDVWEFKGAFRGTEASIRYNTLRITGKEVRVVWDGQEKTFKVSGTYGL